MPPTTSPAVARHDDDPAARLSDGVRTFISLLLFIHLFALGLVFFSNFEGGDWDSDLLRRMKTVVRPYLYALWLDRPYHYHLTYAEPLDYDHYIEAAVSSNDESEPTVIRLPADDLGIGQRRNRYERLAWHCARRAELAAGDELLPLSIGAGLIKQHDAARVQVRCFRKRPLFLDEVRAGSSAKTPDERLYAADIFFLPGNPQPQMNKIGEARDVAPVTGPSAGGSQVPSASKAQTDSTKSNSSRVAPLLNPLLPDNSTNRAPIIPPALPPANK
jgi:hypothetical protein